MAKYFVVFLISVHVYTQLDAQKLRVLAYNVEYAKDATPGKMVTFLKKEKQLSDHKPVYIRIVNELILCNTPV